MCGIVGLHLKNPELHPRLGELIGSMLACMTSRGPDSAGVALFSAGDPARLRLSLRSAGGHDWDSLGRQLSESMEGRVEVDAVGDAAVITAAGNQRDLLAALEAAAPQVTLVGHGLHMDIFKDVGLPEQICERYEIGRRAGYQAVGHTRMATESAITTEHSHPFAPAGDLALVHNGSFSNPATIRRRLEGDGIHCLTDNDTEVAARYLAQQISYGADLSDALRLVKKEMDGFFTLLVATGAQFAVMRDSFACKPAVIAETDGYVAMASEYHALAGLPEISKARVFEPEPEEIYTWNR